MPSTPPFIDPPTGELDIDSIAYEAIPTALVGGVALVSVALAALLCPSALPACSRSPDSSSSRWGAPSCSRTSSAARSSSPTTPRDRSRS